MDTFVVRIFKTAPGQAAPGDEIRGRVEHPPTGRTTTFTGADELVAFIRADGSADQGNGSNPTV